MDQVLAEGYLYWLRALVNLADRAMADEGVDPDVRDRVVARLYGTGPDEVTRVRDDPDEILPRDRAFLDSLAASAPEPQPVMPPVNPPGW